MRVTSQCCVILLLVAQIEEEKKVVEKEREEMLANFEKHKELERQQQEKIRKVCEILCIPVFGGKQGHPE